MATITPIVPDLDGVDPLPYEDADVAGDEFPANSEDQYLVHIKNGHTSAQSVVVNDVSSVAPEAATAFDADLTVSVPTAAERVLRIKKPARFISSTGVIQMTYPDGVTALTAQVYRLPA